MIDEDTELLVDDNPNTEDFTSQADCPVAAQFGRFGDEIRFILILWFPVFADSGHFGCLIHRKRKTIELLWFLTFNVLLCDPENSVFYSIIKQAVILKFMQTFQ